MILRVGASLLLVACASSAPVAFHSVKEDRDTRQARWCERRGGSESCYEEIRRRCKNAEPNCAEGFRWERNGDPALKARALEVLARKRREDDKLIDEKSCESPDYVCWSVERSAPLAIPTKTVKECRDWVSKEHGDFQKAVMNDLLRGKAVDLARLKKSRREIDEVRDELGEPRSWPELSWRQRGKAEARRSDFRPESVRRELWREVFDCEEPAKPRVTVELTHILAN